MRRWITDWLERHQHPASQALHAFAIPLLPGALGLAIAQLLDGSWDLWWRPASLVALSYVLQWYGHRIEGNDMGEWILIKRRLGWPYTAVSPRYSTPAPSARLYASAPTSPLNRPRPIGSGE